MADKLVQFLQISLLICTFT